MINEFRNLNYKYLETISRISMLKIKGENIFIVLPIILSMVKIFEFGERVGQLFYDLSN